MREPEFMESIARVRERDPRYDAEAYLFLREAMDYSVKLYKKPASGAGRHLSAAELMEGFRLLALDEFGPMALTVMHAWGLRSTQDIGNIVFNLVAAGKLGKTDRDSPEDFLDGFDFVEAFATPFLPRRRPAAGQKPPRSRRRGTSAASSSGKEEPRA
jgi:uncharacterized repeat protein (TIGR04138 family)